MIAMSHGLGRFPATRMRRLRAAAWRRSLVRETTLSAADLILPMFVVEGQKIRDPIPSLPGVSRLSIDEAIATAREALALGIPAIALFPAIEAGLKDDTGKEAVNADNLVSRAVRALKAAAPDIGVICDVALDPYTTHGQDGVIDEVGSGVPGFRVGDKVMAMVVNHASHGGYRESIVLAADSVVRIPSNATLIEAATLPMNALTARQSLDQQIGRAHV